MPNQLNEDQKKEVKAIYLKPTVQQNFIQDLQKSLVEIFPFCDDLNKISKEGFSPHLTLGQFETSEIQNKIKEFESTFKPIEFIVSEIYFISRTDKDPFVIKETIKFQDAPIRIEKNLEVKIPEKFYNSDPILECTQKIKTWIQTEDKNKLPKKLEGFEASIKTRLHVNVYVDVDFIIALLELNGWITLNRTGVAPPTDDKIEFHPSLKNTSSSAIENSNIKMPNQLNEDQKKEVKAIYLKSLSYFQNTPHYPKNFTAFRNSVAQLCVVKKKCFNK